MMNRRGFLQATGAAAYIYIYCLGWKPAEQGIKA